MRYLIQHIMVITIIMLMIIAILHHQSVFRWTLTWIEVHICWRWIQILHRIISQKHCVPTNSIKWYGFLKNVSIYCTIRTIRLNHVKHKPFSSHYRKWWSIEGVFWDNSLTFWCTINSWGNSNIHVHNMAKSTFRCYMAKPAITCQT